MTTGQITKMRKADRERPPHRPELRHLGKGSGLPRVMGHLGDSLGLEDLGLPGHTCLLEVRVQCVRGSAWGRGHRGGRM